MLPRKRKIIMKIFILIIIGLYYIVFTRVIYNFIGWNINKDLLFLVNVFIAMGIYKLFLKSNK